MYKHPEQRVGVFIDTANMYHSAKNLFNANVNFGAVLEEVVAGRRLLRAIAYVVKSSSDEESMFFDALDKQGFEVKQKDLQVFASGMKKADWDVGLAVDTIKMADRLDTVIIVSGDGDYTPLVIYLQESKGCLVEVAAFQETTSGKLIEQADDFVNLSADTSKYLIGSKRGKKSGMRKAISRPPRPQRKGSGTLGKKKRKITF